MTTDLFGTDVEKPRGFASVPASPSTEEVDLTEVNQKFGDDLDALKKAKAFADAHIKNLEKEQADLRKELETRLSIEQFMDEIKSGKSTSSNPSENHPGQNEQDDEPVSSDKINTLVKQAINQERTQAQKDHNRALVADGLQKAWGSSFQSKLADKARELNMTREQLNELASTSPQGFLAMVNAKPEAPVPNTAPPRNDRTRESRPQGQLDAEYFKKMRKENPSLYHSVRVQKQIHDLEHAAASRGETFYS